MRRPATRVLLVVAAISAAVSITGIAIVSSVSNNPFTGKVLYVYPQSSAAKAATITTGEDAAVASTLAAVPTAIWLLPEAHPTSTIARFVASVVNDAESKSELPTFVIYGLPGRDCGNLSAGGATAADYPGWISEISDGIADSPAVVILEPDALALSPSCGNEQQTSQYLREAVSALAPSRASIYLDGGHSSWLSPEEMATLLRSAGISDVRGFALNVSNFNPTADEKTYGDTLSGLLGGSHFVIDASRNGAGSNGEWCNPADRRVGEAPGANTGVGALDAVLWIKNPGESDGQCNGGPAAGQWWPSQAKELVGE